MTTTIQTQKRLLENLFLGTGAKARSGQKGYIFTIENKVDAGEGESQLGDFERSALNKYLEKNWHHTFIYLTKYGDKYHRKL